MTTLIHRSEERGIANHSWLKSKFSFSFANYYNPKRTGFGKLIVLNDDEIAANSGFGAHQHDNMEIITIPTEGILSHKDSTGSEGDIKSGEIQVMSAGSGIVHSEYNRTDNIVKLFQIWIKTRKFNAIPRHETKKLNLEDNKLNKIVSGNNNDDNLYIHQDAKIYLGKFKENKKEILKIGKDKGIFLMVVEGSVKINNEILNRRDSIEISEINKIDINIDKNSEILIIEVPLEE